ncbi:MAG: fibrobacter succinogenes major paralogous domain-containing protein [Bacteroidia bacterium]|nr:fibrobacter succinogenes major paralogous domain-containing protein [Bacteroidia bacterium]
MKNLFRISGVILFILIIHSCKKEVIPSLTTVPVTNITATTATSGGSITDEGSGTVIARGVCWNTSADPTVSDSKTTENGGSVAFTSNITQLTPNTTYYVRAYATNSAGTGYGNEIKFTTIGTVNDIESNVYKVIQIGTQVWMVENLKTTKYNDGTIIPNVTSATEWAALTTPGYCWYNNDDATYKNNYGALYNWYSAINGKLCPTGWHVPSDGEWSALITYLGGNSVAGGKLKETGTTHWISPNNGGDNSSGFTGLPGGYRGNNASFFCIGEWGIWWSTQEYSSTNGKDIEMRNVNVNVFQSWSYKYLGNSVRCIKD